MQSRRVTGVAVDFEFSSNSKPSFLHVLLMYASVCLHECLVFVEAIHNCVKVSH